MDADRKRLYEMQAGILQAVAHPVRLAIVDVLSDGERCVCEIADEVGAKRSNVSRHLALMYQAGIVSFRKEGLKVFYSLVTPCITNFFSCVSDVIRHNHARVAEVLDHL
jgi:DNA-binding transcriptional ArsR family regulator